MLHLEHPLSCTNCYYNTNTLYESHRHTSTLLYHERTRCLCVGGVMYGLYETHLTRFQMKIKIYAQRFSFFSVSLNLPCNTCCSFILVCYVCIMQRHSKSRLSCQGVDKEEELQERSGREAGGQFNRWPLTCFTTTLVLPKRWEVS